MTVDELLAEARSTLDRLTPAQAWTALRAGTAVLVDTRTDRQRAATGVVPGAVLVDRGVLEWRFDPASPDRLPEAAYDARVVVLCEQGYSSSLAAATLQRLGVREATDVVGGMEAWVAAGLPTTEPPARR